MSKIKYTPMMSQYLKIKENYQDTLILFRLGDSMIYFSMMQLLLLKN
jgi:DNA mismatch repair ATPase MutS